VSVFVDEQRERKALLRSGEEVGRGRVERLMRERGRVSAG
jgi:hypothetical protein